jgi:hypothetical protein
VRSVERDRLLPAVLRRMALSGAEALPLPRAPGTDPSRMPMRETPPGPNGAARLPTLAPPF